jgi:hypothetical protein
VRRDVREGGVLGVADFDYGPVATFELSDVDREQPSAKCSS